MLSVAKQRRAGRSRRGRAEAFSLAGATLALLSCATSTLANAVADADTSSPHIFVEAPPPFALSALYYVCLAAFVGLAVFELCRRCRKLTQADVVDDGGQHHSKMIIGGPAPIDSIATLDHDACVIDANPRFQAETGLTLDQLKGRPIWALHQKGFGKTFWDNVLTEARQTGVWSGEARTLGEGELPEAEALTVTAKADAVFEFRSRRRGDGTQASSALESRLRDVLTALPSRRAMRAQVENAILRNKAANTALALMIIDLDRFRDINAIFGDDIGDRVLEGLAVALRSVTRPGITVGRIGGDEFILMVENVSAPEGLNQIATEIFAALGEEIAVEGLTCRLSASIGIAQFPKDGETQRDLMQAAGVSLCHAKAKGRGQVCFYADNMEQRSEDSVQMETDLRRAIEEGELLMYYQPQIDLRTGQCIGAEALLRWQHPKKGLLLPGGFVPLALDSGLTAAIDSFVVQEVCRQIGTWQNQGYVPRRISINMSATTLLAPNFAQDLGKLARAQSVDLSQLEIEVLESTMFPRINAAFNTIEDLRSLGVKLAIDDFGTGYSSLAMLKDMPVDRIKLDRRFIKDLPRNTKDDRIVAALVAMGRSLEIGVIAEGVETITQRDRLIELGCPEAQGFLFSRPISANAFARRWLKSTLQNSRVGAAN